MGLREHLLERAVVMLELALESALEMQIAFPIIGFNMDAQLDVEYEAIALVAVPFWRDWLQTASKSYSNDDTELGASRDLRLGY
jgi:hypothetical protein